MCEFCNGKINSEEIKSELTKDTMFLSGSYLMVDMSKRKTKEVLENSSFKISYCPVCGRELKEK